MRRTAEVTGIGKAIESEAFSRHSRCDLIGVENVGSGLGNFGARNYFDGGFGNEKVGPAGGADEPGILEGGKIELLEYWAGVLEEFWSFIQGLYDEAGVDGFGKTF